MHNLCTRYNMDLNKRHNSIQNHIVAHVMTMAMMVQITAAEVAIDSISRS